MRDPARDCEHRSDSHAYRLSGVVVYRADGSQTTACTTDCQLGMAMARAALPIAKEALCAA